MPAKGTSTSKMPCVGSGAAGGATDEGERVLTSCSKRGGNIRQNVTEKCPDAHNKIKTVWKTECL